MESGFRKSTLCSSIGPSLTVVVKVPPVQERPPLMLDFEASPSDEPMFGPQRNVSSTSTTDVHHSSPITVPGSARPSTPPNETTFPVGTVPDSPAPLTKMSEQESTLYHPSRNLDVLMISPSMADPNSTPMPGTNLTLEDTQTPGIVVTSCSPVVKRQEGYFAIPVVKVEDQAAPIDVLVDSQFTKQDVTVPQPDGVYDNLQAIKSTKGAVHCFDSYSITSDASARKSLERKSDCVAAYLALDGPSTVEKNQCAMERRRSTWSRQTGLYDGTGYASSGSHEDYRVNQVTVDDEQDAVLGFPLDQPPIGHQRAGPKTRVSEASADDKETLQEIIRAYAGYEDETPGEEMIELVMGKAELIMDKENMLPRDVAEQTVREAKLAIRIMNRSLGG